MFEENSSLLDEELPGENSVSEESNTSDASRETFSLKYERETIITYNDAEPTANVYTLNRFKKEELLRLAEKFPGEVSIVRQDADSVEAVLPKKWVKIRPPRAMTEEQRAALVERGKALAGRNKDKDTDFIEA